MKKAFSLPTQASVVTSMAVTSSSRASQSVLRAFRMGVNEGSVLLGGSL